MMSDTAENSNNKPNKNKMNDNPDEEIIKRDKKDLSSALINIIGLVIYLIDIALFFGILTGQLSGVPAEQVKERQAQLILVLIVITIFFLIQISYHLVLFKGLKAPLLQRIDRGSMLFLISVLFTPILLNLKLSIVNIILVSILWLFAAFGMLLLIFKKNLSRALAPILAFLSGIIGIIGIIGILNEINQLDSLGIYFFIFGALLLIISGVVYVLKKPDLYPVFYGFHELFHTLLTVGAVILFQLVKIALIA